MFNKRNNYSLEISIIISLIISLFIAGSIGLIKEKVNKLVVNLLKDGVLATHEVLQSTINESFMQAEIYAKIIASSDKIHQLVMGMEEQSFCKTFDTVFNTVDFITVYDGNGQIILQTQEDNYCRDIKNCSIINNGLINGLSIGISKCNHTEKLNIVATYAIKDRSSNVKALVTCGYDLTNPKYINSVKNKILCDIAVFKNDTIISTTLVNYNGENLFGSKMDATIANKVLRKKENVLEKMEILNQQYIGYYTPIINEQEVIGSLFIGVNIEDTIIEINKTIKIMNIILLNIGFFSILTVFILNIIVLSRPVNEFNKFIDKMNANKEDFIHKGE